MFFDINLFLSCPFYEVSPPVWASWTYIQAEILTYTSGIDGQEICKPDNLKYFKVLNFDGIVGKAELICVRENLSQSTFLKINIIKTDYGRKQNWEVNYTQNIYQDGSFFWPFYI